MLSEAKFHGYHQIRQSILHKILPYLGQETLQHYNFDFDQSSFMSLPVGEEGKEIVKHGYRRNIKENIVGAVKLAEKIHTCKSWDVL